MILLSHIIDDKTPTYGNKDKFEIEEISKISDGASANSSKWIFSTNHLGTHIDMPRHFFNNGETLTDVPLNFWYSDKIQIVDVPIKTAKLIYAEDIDDSIDDDAEVLFIRTGYELFRNSDKYWNDNPGLSSEFGIFLRSHKPNIRIVGFDFISLTSWQFRDQGKKAHKAFLNPDGKGKPICVIEDMSLNAITHQINKLTIAPLFVNKSNGSPVTIFAV